jgi:hypothetical protein
MGIFDEPIEKAVERIKADLLRTTQILLWRLTAQNALRVLNDLDPDNAAKYNAALEDLK